MDTITRIPAIQHFMRYKPLLHELVIRDLKLKYRRSFLGYLWSLLNPLLMMTVMTLVFSYMFRFNIENYPLYLICGNAIWSFFSESTTMAMNSVLSNGSLIKKVYVPKFIFPMSRVLSCFVNLSFSLAAILIVLIFTHSPLYWTMLLFPIPLLLLLLFCMGLGMLLSALTVYFRDMIYLYGVLTLAWMYLTPIFYPIDQVPAEMVQVIQMNPMYHYIAFFRDLVLYGRIPEWNTWLFCIIYSAAALIAGLTVFRHLQKNFILYL